MDEVDMDVVVVAVEDVVAVNDMVAVGAMVVVGAVAAVEAKGVVDMMVLEQWLTTSATVILKNKFQYLIQL